MRTNITFSLCFSWIAAVSTLLNISIAGVAGFSPSFRTPRSASLSSHFQLQRPRFPTASIPGHLPTHLKVTDDKSDRSKNAMEQNLLRKVLWIFRSGSSKYTTRLFRFWLKGRRLGLTACTVILFWFGAAGTHTAVSHGSSSSAMSGAISRSNVFSSSLDQMVEKYVKERMFDDDIYDPVESIYREAMDDRLKGSHPKDLKEITSSVLGQNVVKADMKESGTGFSGALMKTVNFLRKQGLSEMQAIALLTSFFVIGVPAFLFLTIMQIATQNKRSMNRLMKKRYGQTYTVDASEKIEEDIDIPDDDDDDDDDE